MLLVKEVCFCLASVGKNKICSSYPKQNGLGFVGGPKCRCLKSARWEVVVFGLNHVNASCCFEILV